MCHGSISAVQPIQCSLSLWLEFDDDNSVDPNQLALLKCSWSVIKNAVTVYIMGETTNNGLTTKSHFRTDGSPLTTEKKLCTLNCPLGIFCVLLSSVHFFKSTFFEKFCQDDRQSVKQIRSRAGIHVGVCLQN